MSPNAAPAITSADNPSYWHETLNPARVTRYPRLEGNHRCDVCVIGGGITGLTTAHELARHGLSVTVLEAHRLGAGTTGGTSAHLDPLTDARLSELVKHFGYDVTKQVIGAGISAIDYIERMTIESAIPSRFQRVFGYLFTERPGDTDELDAEFKTARELGLRVDRILDLEPAFAVPIAAALRFSIHAQMHPLEYLRGLADKAVEMGCRIFEDSPVVDYDQGSPSRALTPHGEVVAPSLVIATHMPIGMVLSLQTRVFPYRSYVIGARLSRPAYPKGLYWDMADPYHYLRSAGDESGEILIVGGADHKTGSEDDPESRFATLTRYVGKHFPVASIDSRWSSQYYQASDHLPYIGRMPLASNVFVATGFEGNGLTFGTIAGLLISDLVREKENAWEPLFRPGRLDAKASAGATIRENADVVKHFVLDRLRPKPDLHAVAPGEGKNVRIDGKQCAAYRDELGHLHLLSAVCTHAKCLVHWNGVEKSWDCPCHGGRFTPTGEVLVGPPVRPLEAIHVSLEDLDEEASSRRQTASTAGEGPGD